MQAATTSPALKRSLALLALTGILLPVCAQAGVAVDAGAGLSMRYTDNAALQASGGQSDWVDSLDLNLGLNQQTGKTRLAANAAVRQISYRRNTFSDQQYYSLVADAGWLTLDNRLDWQLQNTFTQRRISSLNPDIPFNLQDVNVFRIGPVWTLPLGPRQDMSLSAQFRRTYYEVSAVDSEQVTTTLGWLYRLSSAFTLTANASLNDLRYTELLANDFTTRSFSLGFSGSVSRSTYALSLGQTRVARAGSPDQDGGTYRASWSFTPNPTSSLSLTASSRVSEVSGNLLQTVAEESADTVDDSADEEILSGTYRNRLTRVSYRKSYKRGGFSLQWQTRSLDYNGTANDREIRSGNAGMQYRHSSRLTSDFSLQYSNIVVIAQAREDTVRGVNLNLRYSFSRRLNGGLGVSRNRRDSTVASSDYMASSVVLSLNAAF